jgi:glycosyltransferase involved in cell wall biosynthesis
VAAHARARGVSDIVHLLGYVDEVTKHRELSSAWLALAPSAKEGWGLNVVEAASHGVPTIAHHGAGGLSESILDGLTGVLVHDLEGMVEAASELLDDADRRSALGEEARLHAQRHTWEAAVDAWERLLSDLASREDDVVPSRRAVASA